MFYVYVLKSLKYGNRYVGSTNNINKRLREHNAGKCKYTKGRMPWILIYQEEFKTRSESMQREELLKSGQGRRFLDEKLKNYK